MLLNINTLHVSQLTKVTKKKIPEQFIIENNIRNLVGLKVVLCETGQEEEKSNMDMEAGMVIRGMDNTVVKTVYQTVLTAHRA